jgi:hypothetical protein
VDITGSTSAATMPPEEPRGGVPYVPAPETHPSAAAPKATPMGSYPPTVVLAVDCCIKVHLDLQADKSPIVVKGPFFP